MTLYTLVVAIVVISTSVSWSLVANQLVHNPHLSPQPQQIHFWYDKCLLGSTAPSTPLSLVYLQCQRVLTTEVICKMQCTKIKNLLLGSRVFIFEAYSLSLVAWWIHGSVSVSKVLPQLINVFLGTMRAYPRVFHHQYYFLRLVFLHKGPLPNLTPTPKLHKVLQVESWGDHQPSVFANSDVIAHVAGGGRKYVVRVQFWKVLRSFKKILPCNCEFHPRSKFAKHSRVRRGWLGTG